MRIPSKYYKINSCARIHLGLCFDRIEFTSQMITLERLQSVYQPSGIALISIYGGTDAEHFDFTIQI